jgi:hypothetical protein
MATRAERLRAQQERSHQHRPPAQPKKTGRISKAERLLAEVSGTVRPGPASTGLRNLSRGRKATYALEDSAGTKKPSRKSTRRSSEEHVKAATSLTSRQKLRVAAPTARAGRA